MAANRDQPPAAGGPRPEPSAPSLSSLLRGAAHAAELLESACTLGPTFEAPLQFAIVRGLARDLREELETLSVLASEEANATMAEPIEEVEGALRAADVANLAACAVPELPHARALRAAAAAHLAAGSAQALRALVEAGYTNKNTDVDYTPYALRDVRGAAWRARFATRQADEFLWSG